MHTTFATSRSGRENAASGFLARAGGVIAVNAAILMVGALMIPAGPGTSKEGTAAPTTEFAVSWADVHSSPNCWFFSGPADLGRDVQLGDSARLHEVGGFSALAFGSASFGGAVKGKHFGLVRNAGGHGNGGEWKTREEIVGLVVDGGLRGHYRYTECRVGADDDCALESAGGCQIDAEVSLVAR